MSSSLFKKDLIYSNFDELLKQTHFDFTTVNFNNPKTCNSMLKLYDEGNRCLKVGEEEKAYLLLMRFFDGVLKIRSSQLYKNDKKYVDSMISPTAFLKTLETLENLKESIKKRYEEKEKSTKTDTKTPNTTAIEQANLKPVEKPEEPAKSDSIDKKYLNSKELFDLLKQKTNKKYLIIDTRSRNDYDFSHMNLNLVLNDENKKQISYINIPNDLIENVVWNLNESLKKYDKKNEFNSDQTVSQAFESRADYDHLIIFDKDSTYNNLKSESKLAILKRAIYEYDPKKLKNEPIILDGGWSGWITFYPSLTTSTKGANLNNLANSQSDNETSQNSIKKILDFDYPELMSLKKPIVPTPTPTPPPVKPVQEAKNEPKLDLIVNKPQPNNVNENKLEEKITNGVTKPNAAPMINRSNKPSINSSTTKPVNENEKSSSPIKDTKPDETQNKRVFMLSDTSSDEEVEVIASIAEKKPGLVDSNQPPEPTIQPTTANEPINPNIQASPANPIIQPRVQHPKPPIQVQPKFNPPLPPPPKFADDQNSANLNNKIFNSVYAPTRFKPIQTPYMTEGAKVLNSTTGLFSYQPAQPTQPKAQLNQENPVREIKFVPPSSRPRETPKPNNETRTVQLNDAFPREKSNLKRTFSQPNIANMNDEILIESDDEINESNHLAKEKDMMKIAARGLIEPMGKPVINDLSKMNINTTKNNPTPLNIINNPIKTVNNNINNNNNNILAKPNVNRNNKPMPEHIVQLRLQELQPVYGNTHPGLTGIKNLGNTCFMNSILQCLISTENLVNYFLNSDYKKDLNRSNHLGFRGEIADEFSIIVQAIWSGRYRIISPRRFKAIIGEFNQQFISNEQQDAQELLLFLLDGLHEDLNRVNIFFFNIINLAFFYLFALCILAKFLVIIY